MYSSKCRGGAGSAGVQDERTTNDAGGGQVRVIDFDDRRVDDRRSGDRQSGDRQANGRRSSNRPANGQQADDRQANGRQPDHRQTNDRQSDDGQDNDWLAANQFTVVENRRERRPDVVLFVNGLPLAVIELKNPADESATLWSAHRQLQTCKAEIPSLFAFNAALIVSDGLEARIGTLTAGREWFKPWRTITGEALADPHLPQLQVMLEGVCAPRRFLALVRDFIVFEDGRGSGRGASGGNDGSGGGGSSGSDGSSGGSDSEASGGAVCGVGGLSLWRLGASMAARLRVGEAAISPESEPAATTFCRFLADLGRWQGTVPAAAVTPMRWGGGDIV